MFEPVIGLEVHVALRTRSKLFCGCSAEGFGLGPNTNVCPVCLGLPGSLPVVNHEALDLAISFALALGCDVAPVTRFHRKHYFYPDAPKNYQISQFDQPIGLAGRITLGTGRTIGITRCHLEEDAGRLVHPTYVDHSLVDLNRAGAPLLEMVTEPDLRSPEEARDLLTEIRSVARALGVSDASPEEGKMRADVNISLRLPGGPFGTKVEVKNLNSFRNVANAIAFEMKRQSRLLEDGRAIEQETRGFNEGGQRTYTMRGKEGSADYRYLGDPDLPVVHVDEARRSALLAAMPELPAAKTSRYLALGVRPSDARQLAHDVEAARFFDAAVGSYGGPAQNVANWLNSDVMGILNQRETDIATTALRPEALAKLVTLIDEGVISGAIAKDLLPAVIDGHDPATLVDERGLRQVTDGDQLTSLIDAVLDENAELVDRVKANPKAINALLGAVMKASAGKAKPDLVREMLAQRFG
jgi:aspartyl-tRNA(Asn)/glutamyl-tRNA(Gln) amidotransferase subunit B